MLIAIDSIRHFNVSLGTEYDEKAFTDQKPFSKIANKFIKSGGHAFICMNTQLRTSVPEPGIMVSEK